MQPLLQGKTGQPIGFELLEWFCLEKVRLKSSEMTCLIVILNSYPLFGLLIFLGNSNKSRCIRYSAELKKNAISGSLFYSNRHVAGANSLATYVGEEKRLMNWFDACYTILNPNILNWYQNALAPTVFESLVYFIDRWLAYCPYSGGSKMGRA